MSNLILAAIIGILSSFASLSAIIRKKRSKVWAYITLFFPIFVIVVELLPNKNKNPVLIFCSLCKTEISSELRKCPHCGHLLPRKHSFAAIIYEIIITSLWSLWLLLVFLIIFFALVSPDPVAYINNLGD